MLSYVVGLGKGAVCPLIRYYSPEFLYSFALLGPKPGISPVTEGGHMGGGEREEMCQKDQVMLQQRKYEKEYIIVLLCFPVLK